MAISESAVRAAYAKLREFMKESAPPIAKLREIEAQVNLLYDFKEQNAKQLANIEKHADTALAEEHVEAFERVCDWCKLGSIREQSELGPWKLCFQKLYSTLNFRCPFSVALATRLANSNHYVKVSELKLRWDLNCETELLIDIIQILNHLETAPAAANAVKKLNSQILDIYKSKK